MVLVTFPASPPEPPEPPTPIDNEPAPELVKAIAPPTDKPPLPPPPPILWASTPIESNCLILSAEPFTEFPLVVIVLPLAITLVTLPPRPPPPPDPPMETAAAPPFAPDKLIAPVTFRPPAPPPPPIDWATKPAELIPLVSKIPL